MSKIRILVISTGLAAAIFGVPVIAFAAGEIHPGSGEKGLTEYPSHRVMNNDRADVVAERDAARRADSRGNNLVGEAPDYPFTAPKSRSSLSRADVERETIRAMRAGEISAGERS